MKTAVNVLAFTWFVVTSNPNTIVFVAGLVLLCLSVAQWSVPLAGSIAGAALMGIGAWPLLGRKAKD